MKIGILSYDYALSSSISIINAVILLSEQFEVHIFIDHETISKSPEFGFNKGNIIIHDINAEPLDSNSADGLKNAMRNAYTVISQSGLRFPVNYALSKFAGLEYDIHEFMTGSRFSSNGEKLDHYTKSLYGGLYRFTDEVEKYIDDSYVCLIAVHYPALIAASLIRDRSSSGKPVNVVYWNMELPLFSECYSLRAKIIKSLENDCSAGCDLIIIQDKGRANFFLRDSSVPHEKIFYVPVSGLGSAYKEKSMYFHEKFGIDRSKKIILYAGNIRDWSMCLEIAREAQSWKDDKVFVIHTWRTNCINEDYVKKIIKLTGTKKVYLSANPVEYEKLPALLSSADIGIMLYMDRGPNFREIGHSSNKLVDYLKVGLPVISTDFPSLRNVIESYDCGKCVRHPEDIEAEVENIFSDYDAYRNNAFRCYAEEYDFARYFSRVIGKIKEMELCPACAYTRNSS